MERRPALSCRHWLLLGTIAATVLPAIGCASALFSAMYLIKGTDVDADFDGLKQKKVAVVCRPLVGLTYQNSGVAKDLAKQVNLLLAKNVSKVHMIEQPKVAAWEDENTWDEYLEVGRALKADLVVGIDLEQFSILEGQTVFQGKCRAQIKVYDCKTGEEVWSKHLPPVIYPPNHFVSTQDQQEADFRREYVVVLAEHIARHFYAHDPNADLGLDSQAMH